MTDVWDLWQEVENNVAEELAKETTVNDAVATALKQQPEIPSNLINVAGCQRTRLQGTAKAAVLCFASLALCCA